MARTIKSIPIELDKPRTLRFDFNALCSFEDATGLSVFNPDVLTSNLSATKVRALLWAGLLDEDPGLSLKDVGVMLSSGNLSAITAKITAAIKAQTPERSGEDKADTDRPPNA